eukprot:2082684-Rhodomonas_salina.1
MPRPERLPSERIPPRLVTDRPYPQARQVQKLLKVHLRTFPVLARDAPREFHAVCDNHEVILLLVLAGTDGVSEVDAQIHPT